MDSFISPAKQPPPYAPLVPACLARGISRTVAFDMVRRGLLDSFCIGRRRYVYMASLDSLPERLAALQEVG